MKWILFWTFLVLFSLSVLGTLGMVFLGFGTPTESERELLVKGLIGEIAACVIALFYSIFGLKKIDHSSDEKLKLLENRIEQLESKLITSTKEIDASINSITTTENEGLDAPKSNLSHELFPGLSAIKEFDKPAPFDSSLYNLYPLITQIKNEINDAKPFDKKHREDSYIGLKVQWKCTFSGFEENDDGYSISVETEKPFNIVYFTIEKSKDVSKLKIMNEFQPLWVCGEIRSINGTSTELVDADISV
jgi:hypothetical protein